MSRIQPLLGLVLRALAYMLLSYWENTVALSIRLTACLLDLERGVVDRGGDLTRLTSRELALLRYLCERPGQVVTREELLLEVWGYAETVVSRAVDKTVTRLRAKIEEDRAVPDHLLTEYGTGFRFVPLRRGPPRPSAPRVGIRAPFFGRDAAGEALRAIVDGPDRLVTLTGVAGIGKSRLAREVLGEDVPHVNVTGLAGGALDAAVRPHLDAHVLLLESDADDVAALVEAVPRWLGDGAANLVLTSRVPLLVRAERVLRLGPLEPEAARDMLLERARRRRPGWGDDSDEVLRIGQAIDGWPLAIEHLALRSRLLGPAELLAFVRTGSWQAGTGPSDLPDRQRDLAVVLEQTLALVDPAARELATRLAVFEGPATLESVRTVAGSGDPGALLDGLDALSSVGIVRVADDADEARLTLFLPIRDLLRKGHALSDDLRDRHLMAFAVEDAPALHDAAYQAGGPDLSRSLEIEREDRLAALAHAVRTSRLDAAEPLADLLLGHAARAFDLDLGQRVLDLVEPVLERMSPVGRLAIALWKGDQLSRRRDLDAAIALFQQVEDESARLGLHRIHGGALYMKAIAQTWAWDERAQESLEAAVRFRRAHGLNPTVPLQDLGWHHADLAHVPERATRAAALLEEARRSAQEHGSLLSEATILWGQSHLAHLQGRHDEAWSLSEVALPILVQMNRSITEILEHRGRVALGQGRVDVALDQLERARRGRVQEGGFRLARTLGYLAQAHLEAGDAVQAAATITEAEREARQTGAVDLKQVLYQRGIIDMARGLPARARLAWTEAESIETDLFTRLHRLREALQKMLPGSHDSGILHSQDPRDVPTEPP